MERELGLILDAVGDLIVRRDADGRVVFVNAAFRRALGGELSDWIGRWFALAPAEAIASHGGRRRFDAVLDTVAGPASYEWEETTLGDGGAIMVGRDVSAERAGAAAREGARADAEARAEAKEVLFAVVTHELRTPLSGVLGLAKLLDRTTLNPEQRDYVTAISESGRHLLGLVEDMLDAAKLAAGEATLGAHDVDPCALVESVASIVAPRAREKGLDIATCVDATAPRSVVADAGRLRQVLLNLVANAVKFTDAGGVTISLSVEQADAVTATLRFAVTDTGPGISEADCARIFDAFAQGDSSAARKAEGAGLGLSIARGLVDAMGGEMGLKTAPGEGATFFARIAFDLRARAEPSAATVLEGLRVLVAAPVTLTRGVLVDQLAALGAEVRGVPDAETLAAELAADADRLVIVDEALATAAEAHVRAARAALVLIAADERGALAARLKAGYAGWLTKPCRIGSLTDRITRAWRGERSSGAGAAVAEALVVEDRRRAAAPARVLLVEDNPVNRLLAMKLLERMGVAAEAAETGEAALEALAARRFDLIFMDMRLPGVDGLEITRRLRELEGRERRTPVVALTANASDADRRACLKAGMDDFLIKPLDEDGLADVIARWTAGEAQSKLRA